MTEQERFDRCLAEVLRQEGGFVDDPRDPGGASNFGITRAVLGEARGRAVSPDDVAALTEAEATEIYRRRYWAPVSAAELPPGVDLLIFDMAVNMGPRAAVRLLQSALAVEADGTAGSKTLATVAGRPAAETIRLVSELRRRRYRALAGFAVFGRGWLRRTDAVEALALAWADAARPNITGADHVV